MDLARLMDALSQPAAYPHAVEPIEIRQTHISLVFLAGPFAYKIKKPVAFGFLDFSTLDKRRHFCEEEVRLNRRLAPDVYLGVVPVTEAGEAIRIDGTGAVVEWAVRMQRLPEEATLQDRIQRGAIDTALVERFASRLAEFHRQADRGVGGGFDGVARTLREIYRQSEAQVGSTVSRAVFDRLQTLNEEALQQQRSLIEERAAHGMVRDCHGDLHLDHVYYFPERSPPGDLVIVDCIEFNERFRFIDPVADMAFAAMDFAFHGRRDLATAFAETYFRAAGDEQGRSLLSLYTGYRATVRGSVEGLKLAEKEVTEEDRRAGLQKARTYWLLAATVLDEPRRRPCLLLVGGLPGSGKSTLARTLAERAGFVVIRSDVVRKELAGMASEVPSPIELRPQLYREQATEETYAECLRRTEELLFAGRRVLVDATFRAESQRWPFLQAALRWGVPGFLLLTRADTAIARQRLASRSGDASDADWTIYQHVAAGWEAPGPQTRDSVREIDCNGDVDQAWQQALDMLHESRLA